MRKVLCLLGAGVLLASLVVVSSTPAQAQGKRIELTFNHQNPPMSHTQKEIYEPWAKAIEKRTNGMVHIEIYPGSTMSSPSAAYDAALKGICDISWYMCSYNSARFPLASLLDLPIYANSETANRIVGSINKKWPEKVAAEFQGVKLLWWHGCNSTPIHLVNKPVQSLGDLKGMRIRAAGDQAKTLELAGAVPVQMPGPEVYLNLQKGVMDGAALNWPPVVGWKLPEVTKYSTTTMIGGGAFVTVMNRKSWDALPKEAQKIIEEETEKVFLTMGPSEDAYFAKLVGEIRKSGHQVFDLSPEELEKWIKLCKPQYEEWAKKAEAKGLPGKDILNLALSISDNFRKESAKKK